MNRKALWAIAGVLAAFAAFAAIGVISFYSVYAGDGDDVESSPLSLDKAHSYFAFYESDESRLFSIFYRIRNNTDGELGPFYVKYLFFDDAVIGSMVMNQREYAPHEESGGELITLSPGEVYQSGHSFEAVNDPDLAEFLRKNAGQVRILKILFIERDTGEPLGDFWIDKLEYAGEDS